MDLYFNTSNVTIQLNLRGNTFILIIDFNTSNVTIQLNLRGNTFILIIDFNTSNVTIQPLMSNINGITLVFQYI